MKEESRLPYSKAAGLMKAGDFDSAIKILRELHGLIQAHPQFGLFWAMRIGK